MARPKEHLIANASAAFLVKCEKERTRLIQRLTDQYRFDLHSLLEDNSQADLTVVLPGETFFLHSAVLKSRCLRFYEEFLDSLPPGSSKHIDSENLSQVRDVIKAIYTSDDLSAVDLVLAKWVKRRKRNSDSACSSGELVLDFAEKASDPNGNVTRKPPQGMDLFSPDIDIKFDVFNDPKSSGGDLMTPFDPNLDFETGLTTKGLISSPNKVASSQEELMTVDGPASVGCCKVADDLLSMYRSALYTDVVVIADGREFKAHRCVLAARSTYFSAMLSGSWIESESQTIRLEGLNAAVIEQILLCLYGSASVNLRDCKLTELVAASDMYAVNSVKDIISYELKMDYCHFFHKPCSGCVASVPEAMPLAYTYGLRDVLDRCYKWNARHFARLWPTKHFAILPSEILSECCKAVVHDLTCDNIIDVALDYEKLTGSLPHGRVRWSEPIVRLANQLKDECVGFLKNHLVDVVSTEKFKVFGRTNALGLSLLEDVFGRAILDMPPEKGPSTYCTFVQLDEWASRFSEDEGDPDAQCHWTEEFKLMIKNLRQKCQQYVNLHIQQLVVTESWKLLPTDLQMKLKEGAFYVDVKHIKKKEPPKRRDHKISMYGRVQKPKDGGSKSTRPGSKASKPKAASDGDGAVGGATVLPSDNQQHVAGSAEGGDNSDNVSHSAETSTQNKKVDVGKSTTNTEQTPRPKSSATRKMPPGPGGSASSSGRPTVRKAASSNCESHLMKMKSQSAGLTKPTKFPTKDSQIKKKQLTAHKDEPREKKPKTSGDGKAEEPQESFLRRSSSGRSRSGIPTRNALLKQQSRECDELSSCSHLAAQGSQCTSLDDVSMSHFDSLCTSGAGSPSVEDPYPLSEEETLGAGATNHILPGIFGKKLSAGNNHKLVDEDSVSLCSHTAVRGSPDNSGNSSPNDFGDDYPTLNGFDLDPQFNELHNLRLSSDDPSSANNENYSSQVDYILATVEAVHFDPEPMVATLDVKFEPPEQE